MWAVDQVKTKPWSQTVCKHHNSLWECHNSTDPFYSWLALSLFYYKVDNFVKKGSPIMSPTSADKIRVVWYFTGAILRISSVPPTQCPVSDGRGETSEVKVVGKGRPTETHPFHCNLNNTLIWTNHIEYKMFYNWFCYESLHLTLMLWEAQFGFEG